MFNLYFQPIDEPEEPAQSESSEAEPPIDASRCADSPATPEIASMFKDDYKIFSSMSDSDQRRYQELCRRPSSIDSDSSDSYRATRHGSLLLSSHRIRSNSAFFSSKSTCSGQAATPTQYCSRSRSFIVYLCHPISGDDQAHHCPNRGPFISIRFPPTQCSSLLYPLSCGFGRPPFFLPHLIRN